MQAIVTMETPQFDGVGISLQFRATGVWGDFVDTVTIAAGVSPTRLATAIKTKVGAFAATLGLTLTARDIWVIGLGDEQDFRRVTADRATQSNVFADVPDLAFQLAPNAHYKFSFSGMFTAQSAATGLQLSVNGPASPVFVRFMADIGESATTKRSGGAAAYDNAIAGTNSAGATPIPFWLEGSISTGDDATDPLVLRFRSEINGNTVTILRGAIGEIFAAA
jgi:hypothetical protein